MSAVDFTTTATVVYDVRGIDRSIRSSQRLLLTVNAVRLSIEDFKRLGEDPSLTNLLWTGIQLTRVWTNLLRLVKATNQAQRFGFAQTAVRGAAGRVAGSVTGAVGAPMGFGVGGAVGAASAAGGQSTLWTTLISLTGLTGAGLGVLTGGAALLVGFSALGYRKYFIDRKNRIDFMEYRKLQREIAKSQGYEY